MKIIAKAHRDCFIVEASEDELANIAGFAFVHQMKDQNRLEVGRELRVTKLFSALAVERSRRAEIEAMANSLRKAADRIDSINAALDCPIVEPAQS